jgi:thiamine-phosphate pyrophosphorylase
MPKTWLMTDERLGDALLPSIATLPKGSGVVFRHYSLDPKARRKLFLTVSALARRYRHMVVVVHSRREAIAAERAEARLLFVSPIFATRSHPGASALGRARFGLLIANLRVPVIALGGMNKARARSLRIMKIHGWAAISALAAAR